MVTDTQDGEAISKEQRSLSVITHVEFKSCSALTLSYLAMVENKCLGIYVSQIYTCSIDSELT